jgi:hypothetical protein
VNVADVVHDRIVTPDTDPDRFTRSEVIVFRAGKCSWAISNGHFGETFCMRTSKRGASFGNCDEHDADMLVDHFPDGTPRADEDPRYRLRPDYQVRVDAALAGHRGNCVGRDCECRGNG